MMMLNPLTETLEPAFSVYEYPMPRGWKRAPHYYAVEVPTEPGVFQCPAKGVGFWSSSQLRQWATDVAATLVLVSWVH